MRIAAKEAAKQAVKQVAKKSIVNATRKTTQTVAKKSVQREAKKLGYNRTKQLPKNMNSKGNPVYVNRNASPSLRYISPDKTRHIGQNQWKGFDTKGDRSGTYKIVKGKLVRFRR